MIYHLLLWIVTYEQNQLHYDIMIQQMIIYDIIINMEITIDSQTQVIGITLQQTRQRTQYQHHGDVQIHILMVYLLRKVHGIQTILLAFGDDIVHIQTQIVIRFDHVLNDTIYQKF